MSTAAPVPAPGPATGPAAGPAPVGTASRRVTWREALDRLEAHADRAEELIRGHAAPDDVPWSAPEDIGPIPDEFVPRARQLLARQQRLMAAIPALITDTRRQQQVAGRVSEATTAPARPVYLDITA